MSLEDFLAKLDPKTAKRIKTAQEVELIRYPVASTGLTMALGGGIGAGRVTLCYGNYSSGKSLLFQQSIGQIWQPMGLVCAYVDVEGTYDKEWGARLGIDNSEMPLIQSKSAGRVEKEIKPLIENGIDIIVIDSISDIVAEAFVDEKTGQLVDSDKRKQMGAHAKAITNLVNGIHYMNERTAVVLLSQTTTEIGQTYVKQIPHGGKKILYASSQIIKLTSSGTENAQIKGEVQVGDLVLEESIGRKVEYYVEKNKIGQPGRKGEYDMYYAGETVGIDNVGEVADLGEKFGLIKKSGAWMTILSENKQFQGRKNLVKHLRENYESRELLESQIADILSKTPAEAEDGDI